ncbi:hypothetical protein IWQ60_008206 [Tieghemiomyces parasiticus]|uniref:Metallo-beta-lactamase domain-containing protein n=1 Tax=Tieghemiomyces parasiticus TaxID=78921 RepID=A0A9W7ZT87_9FUNG|nr:hypothetical protein IWQ60_008206 [Tieghemiomyces parasiticus]
MAKFSFATLGVSALASRFALAPKPEASPSDQATHKPADKSPSTPTLSPGDLDRNATSKDRPSPSRTSTVQTLASADTASPVSRRKSAVLRRLSLQYVPGRGSSSPVRNSFDPATTQNQASPKPSLSSSSTGSAATSSSRPAGEAHVYTLILNANEHFERERYPEAIAAYTRAMTLIEQVVPESPAEVEDLVCMLYSNRSMAHFMRSELHDSLRDAEKVVQTRPLWSKGHFRKGEALLALGMFELAVIHYGFASDLEPQNRELRVFAQKARLLRADKEQGLAVFQLLAGRDIACTRGLNPIQNKIFDFAKKMRNYIYLIVDRESKQCAIVDACWDVPGIMRVIKKEGLTPVAAIVTHYHFDHVGGIPPAPFDALHIRVSGLDTVMKKYPHLKAYVHEKDLPYVLESNPGLPTGRVTKTTDQYAMTLGVRTTLRFLHTPGHSEGSQCIMVNESRLFTGDTLFPTSCGRVDLPGGCKHDMVNSLQHILKNLDPAVMIYPGHDYGGSWSTIETEQLSGLLRDGYTAEWDEYNNLQLS